MIRSTINYRPMEQPGGSGGVVKPTFGSPAAGRPDAFFKHQDTLAQIPGQFGGLYRDMFGQNSDAAMRGYEAYVGGHGNLLNTYGSGVTQAGSDYMNNLGGT